MCEIHVYKCACGKPWTYRRKLSSCESPDPAAKCPESLCMYVGTSRRPQRKECGPCRELREAKEALDEPAGRERTGKVADGTG